MAESPDGLGRFHKGPYELGSAVRPSTNGVFAGARLYALAEESGEQSAGRENLNVRITWGHRSAAKGSFFIGLGGAELQVTKAQPIKLEPGETLRDTICRSEAGDGDVDGAQFTLIYHKRSIEPLRKIVGHWTYLIAQSEPVTAERWWKDAGYRPDSRKLVLRLNEGATRGFSLTVDQLLRERSFWFPELDMFVAVGDDPKSWNEHLAQIERSRGHRVLDKVKAEKEATYEDFTNRWADMGNPGFHNPFQVGPGHIVCVTWDSALYKFGIDRGGGVVNDYAKADEFRFGFDFGRLGKALESTWKGQHLVDGLPVINTTVESADARHELEQFAYPLHGPPTERRGDVPMVLMQRLKLTDLSGHARKVRLGMTHERLLRDGGERSAKESRGTDFQVKQEGHRWTWQDARSGRLLLAIDGPGVRVSSNSVTGRNIITNRIELEIDLTAGGSRQLVIKLPSPLVSEADQQAFTTLDYLCSREQTLRFWRDHLSRGAEFHVPEKVVNDLFRANLWHALRLPRRHGGESADVKIDLPYSNFAYDQSGTPWPVNQGVLVDYMLYDLRGYHGIVREELAAIFRNNQRSDGRVGGFADWGVYSPGMLYSVAQNCLLSGDRAAFEALLPQTFRTLDYCLAQIRRTEDRAWRGAGLVLLPLNDLTSALNPWAFNQAYYSAGFELLGEALAAIGHSRASECREAATRLKGDIERAFGSASVLSPAVQMRDHTWMPYVPCDASTPRRLMDAWYPTDVDTGALHLSRLRALDPAGFLTTCLLHDHEDNLFLHGWGMANEPVYNQQAMSYLWRDEPKAAIRAFYSGMACAFSHSVFEPVEHRWHHPQYFGPPSTDGTWFELYRNMLIQEREQDTLLLLQATPRKWLEDGKRISVERAPTYYGPISMRVESQAASGRITATIQTPVRKAPAAMLVRFRHPEAKPIQSVLVNSGSWKDFDPKLECVRLPNPKEPQYTIVVRY